VRSANLNPSTSLVIRGGVREGAESEFERATNGSYNRGRLEGPQGKGEGAAAVEEKLFPSEAR